VLDAFMRDIRPMVVREGVVDRSPEVFEANLFDLDQKYADVVSLSEALAYLAGLSNRQEGEARQP
jgi:maleamate amidohydrolase